VTGTFVAPTNTTSQFNVFVGNGSAMQADFVADVVGYFSPPNRSGDGLRVATTTFANTVLVTNGSSANSISATSPGSTIGGGGSSATTTTVPNIPASDTFTFGPNQIIGNAPASTIAGGNRNVIEQSNLAVNTAFSTIGGGHNNRVNAYFGTIAGGISNVAGQTTFNTFGATIGGGFGNNAYSSYATIGGGSGNQAGFYSVAPGGFGNVVASNFSFGAGRGARTDDVTNPGTRYDGVFIWADSNGASPSTTQSFHANAQDQFAVRARGGVAFRVVSTNTAGAGAGCTLPAGGAASWTCSSDRNLKEAVQNISPRAILAKVSALPLSTWQFIGTNRRHLGPMAQDFRAAFGLGEDDKHITTADVSGVALAAIQGLNEKLIQKDAEISKLKSKAAKVDKLEAELAVIKRKLGL
jgi:trimeric autotransporter adhesin